MQEKFAIEYLRDFNAVQAAVRAGYSETTAHSNSHVMIEEPEIKELVAKHISKIAKRNDISAERVLKELARIAFANIREVAKWNGNKIMVKNSDELTEDEVACISEIKETKDGVQVKFHDKAAALDKLGKYLKLFNDTVDVNLTINLADKVAQARARRPVTIEQVSDDV